jgi:hypothetical protein
MKEIAMKNFHRPGVVVKILLILIPLIAALVLTSVLTGCDNSFMPDTNIGTADGVVVEQAITVNFTSLPHETIELAADSKNELSRTQKDILRITVDGALARWFIDGEEQAEAENAITIAAVDYPVGIHHVTALVYKDGIPYSDTLTFKVMR